MCPWAQNTSRLAARLTHICLNDAVTTIRTAPNTFISSVAFTEEVPNSNPI